jgi:hypothetical protein
MEYNTGSNVKVRLYSGQIVDANITSIVSRSAGRKIHIAYDGATTVVNPAQIIEVTQVHAAPKHLTPAQPHTQHHGFAQKHAPVAVPAQNVAHAPAPLPKSVSRKLTTSQILRNIADDYRQLAAGDAQSNGKTADQRESNYHWLIKLADKIKAKTPLRPL